MLTGSYTAIASDVEINSRYDRLIWLLQFIGQSRALNKPHKQ